MSQLNVGVLRASEAQSAQTRPLVFLLQTMKRVQVQPLHKGYLVQPEQYPRFTLVGQAVGAVGLGYEALSLLVPEVSNWPGNCLSNLRTPFL